MALKFKSVKQKRALLVAAIAVFALGIGLTIAYNMDTAIFANLFKVKDSKEEYIETFSSPDDWQPCQEIPKTAIATNKNDTVRYARMKLDEYWRTKNSQTDPNDHTTSDLPLTWDDNGTTKNYAVINTQNDNDWELRSDGWYYYKTPLQKDQSTNSLLKSVTLNCDATLVADGANTSTGTGQVVESVPTAYAEANYHLYVTMQLSDEEWEIPEDPDSLTSIIKRQVNPATTPIDFRQYAIKSDDPVIANGNGVNKTTEMGRDVYYFRGEVDNNNVVFANRCWKILRTTYTGGVKLILNPSKIPNYQSSDGENYTAECVDVASPASLVTDYNPGVTQSPASVGYMFGFPGFGYTNTNGTSERYYSKNLIVDSVTGMPGLDMNDGKYVRGGFWNALSAGKGYYYYCENAFADDTHADWDLEAKTCLATVHSDVFPAYMIYNGGEPGASVTGLIIRGNQYKNFEELKEEMFSNKYSSALKQTVDGWYRDNISEGYGQYVEDPIFCNDRSIYVGPLGGINSPLEKIADFNGDDYYYGNHFNGYYRNAIEVDGNYHPSLDCPNQNDAFTVDDSVNGNAALDYPVGVFTADELTFAGLPSNTSSNQFTPNSGKIEANYLFSLDSRYNHITMTPMSQTSPNTYLMFTYARSYGASYGVSVGTGYAYNPVISLKKGTKATSGDGTLTNPYVIPE